ncbi:MAG: acetyl-CoA C-acyltransferase [SAR324 cluster bacterium]|nr:acetyl-CoA C-acyltransferase [SAR324 cluster bacterium]
MSNQTNASATQKSGNQAGAETEQATPDTPKKQAPAIKKSSLENKPVLIDGVRTPFLRSNGAFTPLMSHDLGRFAIQGLLKKTGIDPAEIEQVIMGTVLHEVNTPNVARESMLGAGLAENTPAYTVSMACISSNLSATSVSDMIKLGHIQVGIAGGVDTCSDPPLRLSKKLRQTLARLQKAKSNMDYVKELSKLSFRDLLPDVPSITEFSTGESMGQGCERLVKFAGVSREESDEFAARSHQLAAKAWEDKVYQEMVVPVHVPPKMELIAQDNGPRGETSVKKLLSLKPAFDKQFGVVTAGNSSFLTDGGSAVLFMSHKKAEQLKFQAKAVLVDYVFRAGSPLNELLSGPALTIPVLLDRNGLKADDIDVWEIHEAFASQVVANLKLMESNDFVKNRLGLKKAVGPIPMEKINIWGGSLSLGHPFGATGGRLLTTAAQRLQLFGGRYAVVSGCAAGGHGSAILLENPQFSK